MKKLSSKYLFVLSGLVLVSLIAVQLYWISSNINLQKDTTERTLKDDLQQVVKEVEEDAYCFDVYAKSSFKIGEGFYLVKQSYKDGQFYGKEQGGHVDTIGMYNVFNTKKGDSVFYSFSHMGFSNYSATLDISLKFRLIVDSNTSASALDSLDTKVLNINNYKELLADSRDITELVDVDYLHNKVQEVLLQRNLDTNYILGIKKASANSYNYLSQNADTSKLNSSVVRSYMLEGHLNDPYELVVFIPNSFTNVIKSMSIIMLSSIIVIIILVVLYVYFVRTILNQKRLSTMKNTFINNITHEFRTPITNINLAIDNWNSNKTNSDFYMKIIDEENRHMERNVEQILQLAVLEHENDYTIYEQVDMDELIKETIRSFKMQLQNTNGKIKIELNATDPVIQANKVQIRNLLHNLIDNAVKYSEGKPEIEVSTYTINSKFVLQVKDNGIGMSSEIQKHIFDRFYRGNSTDTHDVKGFGLGLSYVKYIVDMHNGEIVVKSKEGKGTQFTVYLPKNK